MGCFLVQITDREGSREDRLAVAGKAPENSEGDVIMFTSGTGPPRVYILQRAEGFVGGVLGRRS
jgi:hypothetical protein